MPETSGNERTRVEVVVSAPEDNPNGVYCNHVQISSVEHDFVLDFAQVLPAGTREQLDAVVKAGKVELKSKVRVVLPVSVMPALLGALRNVLTRFAKDKGLELPADTDQPS